MTFDTAFPEILKKLHELPFDYDGGDGIEFEPYPEFCTAQRNSSWFRAWTGNKEVDGGEFRIFGQDGSGGYAAFWLVLPGRPVLEQPVVFMGSEGECGVVAKDFADYLWLLAGGFGPLEAVAYPEAARAPLPEFERFAAERAPGSRKSPAEVLAAAQVEFPKFEDEIRALCR